MRECRGGGLADIEVEEVGSASSDHMLMGLRTTSAIISLDTGL